MADSPVNYVPAHGLARITLDDGKANALTPVLLAELDAALDRAIDDDLGVVLLGRPGRFCAGFDLATLLSGGDEALALLRAGFEVAERLLAFPRPVVVGCTGHAMAMGAFLLLAGDHRIGAAGAFKIAANEVAIGLTMPHAAIEICRLRLSTSHFHRVVVTADTYGPTEAVSAGFLDEVVPADEVAARADAVAERLASLDLGAYRATKARVHGTALAALRAAIEQDGHELRAAFG